MVYSCLRNTLLIVFMSLFSYACSQNFLLPVSSDLNADASDVLGESSNSSAMDPPDPDNFPFSDSCTTPQNFKVGILGDTGFGANAYEVSRLMGVVGVDMVLHAGDVAYTNDPAGIQAWVDMTDETVPGVPYIIGIGNHDYEWDAYHDFMMARNMPLMASIPEFNCDLDDGDLVNFSCTYHDIFVLAAGVGSAFELDGDYHHGSETIYFDEEKPFYIEKLDEAIPYIWAITNNHQPSGAYNVEKKEKDLWGFYELVRQYGAIMVQGHAHAYMRTKGLINTVFDIGSFDDLYDDPISSKLSDLEPSSTADAIRIAPGSTMVIGNGLGGQGLRNRARCFPPGHALYDADAPNCIHIAKSFAKEDGVHQAPMICSFNYNGNCKQAHCQLLEASSCVKGLHSDEECLTQAAVLDEFDLYSDRL